MRRVAWLVLAIGCSGTSSTSPTDQSELEGCGASVDALPGTGAEMYIPLDALDPVVMVHGPQGGWHVETAAFVTGSTAEVSVLPRIVRKSDGVRLAGDQQEQFIALVDYDDDACTGSFFSVRAFLDDTFGELDTGTSPQDVICGLAGEILTLTIAVTDLNTGAGTEATVDVTATLDPNDIQICP
ncbi:MAG: hypothetical protein H6738_24430 [Alphaproteobacteria bacterium]|nr:hypothetical protein [Alphaproteobacteria bacterium]MCB9699957.1 hypothetical protein [Alphaproteobacteria bacterium]